MLIHQVQPVFPPITSEVRGAVVLKVEISRDGDVTNVTVLSGPEMLYRASVDAVRQWKYRPFVLNGAPANVETTVVINVDYGGVVLPTPKAQN